MADLVIERDINTLKMFPLREKLQPCRDLLLSKLGHNKSKDTNYLRSQYFKHTDQVKARHYITFALLSLLNALKSERIRTNDRMSTLAADVDTLFQRVINCPVRNWHFFRLLETLLLPDSGPRADMVASINANGGDIDPLWTCFSEVDVLAWREGPPEPLDPLVKQTQLGSGLPPMKRDWARPYVGDARSVVRRAVIYWERQCQLRAAAAAAAAASSASAAADDNAETSDSPHALTLPLYAKILCLLQSSGSGKSRLAAEFGRATCPQLTINLHRHALTYPRPDGEIVGLFQQPMPEWVRAKIMIRREWLPDYRDYYTYMDWDCIKSVRAHFVVVALLLASFEELERWLLNMPASMSLRELAELRCVEFGPNLDVKDSSDDSRMPSQRWFSFGVAGRANDLARLWAHRLPKLESGKYHSVETIGESHVERLLAQAERVVRLLERHARDESHAPLFAVQFDGVDALLDMTREHDKALRKRVNRWDGPSQGDGSVGMWHFEALVRVIARLRHHPVWFLLLTSDGSAHKELTMITRARRWTYHLAFTETYPAEGESEQERTRTLLFTDFDVDYDDRRLSLIGDCADDQAESRRRELKKPLREFARPGHLARFGRPLWTAYPGPDRSSQKEKDKDDSNDESDDHRRSIASLKLMTGLDSSYGYRSDDEKGAFGMLLMRVGFMLNRSLFAAEVESTSAVALRLNVYKRCIIGGKDSGDGDGDSDAADIIDEDIGQKLAAVDVLLAAAPSEPLLAREAMGHILDWGWREVLEEAAKTLSGFWKPLAEPPPGCRATGALYSRIVLSVAHDSIRSRASAPSFSSGGRYSSRSNSSSSIHPSLELGHFLDALYCGAGTANTADTRRHWLSPREEAKAAAAAAAAAVVAKVLALLPRQVTEAKLNFLQFPGAFGLLDRQPWIDSRHLARSAADMPRLMHELLRRSAALQIPQAPPLEEREVTKGARTKRGGEKLESKTMEEKKSVGEVRDERHDGKKPEVIGHDEGKEDDMKPGGQRHNERLELDKEEEKQDADKTDREKHDDEWRAKHEGEKQGNEHNRSWPFSKVIPLYFGPGDADFDEDNCSALLVVDRLEAEAATSPWLIFGENFTDAALGEEIPRLPSTPTLPATGEDASPSSSADASQKTESEGELASGRTVSVAADITPTSGQGSGAKATSATPPLGPLRALRYDNASPFSFFHGGRHPLVCLIVDMGVGNMPAPPRAKSAPSQSTTADEVGLNSPAPSESPGTEAPSSPVQVYVSTHADPHIWVIHSRGRGSDVFRCMESKLESVMEQYLPYV